MVGASGAISGVLGAYLLLYPRVRVHALLPLGFYITTITLPAYVMLGYWILLQVLGSLPALGAQQSGRHGVLRAHRRVRGGTRADPAVREAGVPGAASGAPRGIRLPLGARVFAGWPSSA